MCFKPPTPPLQPNKQWFSNSTSNTNNNIDWKIKMVKSGFPICPTKLIKRQLKVPYWFVGGLSCSGEWNPPRCLLRHHWENLWIHSPGPDCVFVSSRLGCIWNQLVKSNINNINKIQIKFKSRQWIKIVNNIFIMTEMSSLYMEIYLIDIMTSNTNL